VLTPGSDRKLKPTWDPENQAVERAGAIRPRNAARSLGSTSHHTNQRSDDDFEAFYQASYPRLVGQLTILTGSLEDAEDAVQEAFARASTRWARLRDYDAPEAWVRRVALNLATSGLRRARRQLAAVARLGAATTEPARSTDRLAIEAGLRRLPLHYRQVLVLHYGADLPVEQVAQQLRLPTGTVKSRLARARSALGVHLEEGQEERGHARG
jgi:RNA polymerase sigma-70 factor, ECF subfamily